MKELKKVEELTEERDQARSDALILEQVVRYILNFKIDLSHKKIQHFKDLADSVNRWNK